MTSATIRRGRTVRRVVSHLLLAGVALLFLCPLAFAVATALKPPGETFRTPPSFLGSTVRWQNFADVFAYVPFERYRDYSQCSVL